MELLMGVLTMCPFGVWVIWDAKRRRATRLQWALGTVLATPIVLPMYLATRPQSSGLHSGSIIQKALRSFVLLWLTVSMVVLYQREAIIEALAETDIWTQLGGLTGIGAIATLWFALVAMRPRGFLWTTLAWGAVVVWAFVEDPRTAGAVLAQLLWSAMLSGILLVIVATVVQRSKFKPTGSV